MKILIVINLIVVSLFSTVYSQSKIAGKFDVGYLLFGERIISADNQKFNEYNLQDEHYGANVNLISGVKFNDKVFIGIGIGYLNFDFNNSGIQGFSAFSNFEVTPPSYKRFNLYFQSKLGYSQLFSQFWEGTRKETGTPLAEFNVGLKHHFSFKMEIYLQSGVLFTQQSVFLPIRIGIGF